MHRMRAILSKLFIQQRASQRKSCVSAAPYKGFRICGLRNQILSGAIELIYDWKCVVRRTMTEAKKLCLSKGFV